MSSRTRVVFIAGMARSGTTILELMLARMSGWVAGGELRRYWHGASTPGWVCGCRRPIEECDFWRQVSSELRASGIGPDSYDRLLAVQQSHLRLRPLSTARLVRDARRTHDPSPALDEYQRAMAALYRAVAKTADARVVVDSSKQPQDAYLTTWNPGVEMFAIHLVRDPRGVAHSFAKRVPEPQPDLDYMPQSRPFGTASRWTVRHGFVEAMVRPRLRGRYLQLRYEDVVRDPLETIRRVAKLVDGSMPATGAVDDGRIDLTTNHTFSGNPMRLGGTTVEVNSDDAWTAEMPGRDRAMASLAAAPLIGRYGYARLPRNRRQGGTT